MDEWTGVLIGRMHNAGISYDELAKNAGIGKSYLSMILNCKKRPKDIQIRLEEAFLRALERKK